MHEGLHSRYHMARAEGRLPDCPTANRHYQIQQTTAGYEGDHQVMAEGNVGTLVQGMIRFDQRYGSTHSGDWHTAIAWWGSLTRATSNWKNLATPLKNKYIKIQENENKYMDYLKARANYVADKSELNKSTCTSKKLAVDWPLYRITRTR